MILLTWVSFCQMHCVWEELGCSELFSSWGFEKNNLAMWSVYHLLNQFLPGKDLGKDRAT